MKKSRAKIWARRIHDGACTLDDVYEEAGDEGVEAVRNAYFSLYGVWL